MNGVKILLNCIRDACSLPYVNNLNFLIGCGISRKKDFSWPISELKFTSYGSNIAPHSFERFDKIRQRFDEFLQNSSIFMWSKNENIQRVSTKAISAHKVLDFCMSFEVNVHDFCLLIFVSVVYLPILYKYKFEKLYTNTA